MLRQLLADVHSFKQSARPSKFCFGLADLGDEWIFLITEYMFRPKHVLITFYFRRRKIDEHNKQSADSKQFQRPQIHVSLGTVNGTMKWIPPIAAYMVFDNEMQFLIKFKIIWKLVLTFLNVAANFVCK